MGPMKTATTPPVRIDPALLEEIEQSLDRGETLACQVETAVRHEITRRRTPPEVIRLGMAAIERTAVAGDGIASDGVIARLEARLAEAKKACQE